MLLFSDLHLRPESEEVCFRVLDDLLETVKSLNCGAHSTIGFLGDFWHMRYAVPVHLLNRVAKWVQKVLSSNMDLILLPGNHDQVDELGQHALEVFADVGARVYSSPTWDEWGFWMPYRKDKEVVADTLGKWASSSLHKAPKVLFGHLPVNGAMMNNLRADSDGQDPGSFAGFSKVMLGHYHKRQVLAGGRITYIGSPWQTRADEYGQQKGFAVWDDVTQKLTFLDRNIGTRYHRIEAVTAEEALSKVPLIGPEDVVQVSLPTKADLDATLKGLHKVGVDRIIGHTKDLDIPQPRYGFHKGTLLNEYAAAWAKEHGGGVASTEELVKVWEEIAG